MNLLTVQQLASRWSCSRDAVYALISSGQLPSFRAGGKLLRIKLGDIEAWESGGASTRSEDTGFSSSKDRPLPSGERASRLRQNSAMPRLLKSSADISTCRTIFGPVSRVLTNWFRIRWHPGTLMSQCSSTITLPLSMVNMRRPIKPGGLSDIFTVSRLHDAAGQDAGNRRCHGGCWCGGDARGDC